MYCKFVRMCYVHPFKYVYIQYIYYIHTYVCTYVYIYHIYIRMYCITYMYTTCEKEQDTLEVSRIDIQLQIPWSSADSAGGITRMCVLEEWL